MSSRGLNRTVTQISEKVNAKIKSRVGKYEADLECYIVSSISDSLPQSSYDISYWQIPIGMPLADPQFNLSRPIDILIGGERFYEMLLDGKFILRTDLPQFQQFVFGWVCVGAVFEKTKHSNFHIVNNKKDFSNDELHQSLKSLFDIDHLPEKKILSKEELFCEKHFSQTFARDREGRYIVSLPLKSNVSSLGESKQGALSRLQYLERKFDSNSLFKEEYSAVMKDYIDQGHMKLIENSAEYLTNQSRFYLPHHAVVKRSSTTTQIRVVFDASAKSSSGLSLNDVMCIGPTVQNTSYNIILRFRRHKYVFTSDISQMYRQVKISSQQTSLQRILWRATREEPINVYELTRVTFGTAAAPYLATRALKQLATDGEQAYRCISEIIQKDVYVDDILTGSNNMNKIIQIQKQLTTLLHSGGFKLHKWCSNSEQILKNIPKADWETLKLDKGSADECLKTLGLIWIPKLDVFKFNVPQMSNHSTTKRKVLSDMAKLYDPLGLLSPTMVTAKIFLQRLWKSNMDWDDPLSDEMIQYWSEFCKQLVHIKDIQVDRRITIDNSNIIQLHGFADASEKGYGACVYIRSIDCNEKSTVKLVCSKSRVAPIKFVSLPRLELCAALIMSRLVNTVVKTLEIPFHEIYLWSDSTIVLSWIQAAAHKMKTFVANRVDEIQELTTNYIWNHINTSQNPADIISRGIMPCELANFEIWWNGPDMLRTKQIHFETDLSKFVIQHTEDNVFECKKEQVTLLAQTTENALNILEKYSSYNRLLRVIAYCRRFINNTQSSNLPLIGNLSADEIQHALTTVVKIVQREHFSKEIKLLLQQKPLSSRSSILSLNPFVDSTGILRVGGRLNNSEYAYDIKHQILLPHNSHLNTLIFRHHHLESFHAGPQLLISLVRQKFWPISARSIAKQYVRKCVTCFKVNPRFTHQIIGDLPAERITPSRPFENTGIDLCGPFSIKDKKLRKSPVLKAYVAIFICFATKGTHLEILSNLTTDCFLACLKRFIYRRGKPTSIWTDNATNFVGTKNELEKWNKLLQADTKLQSYYASQHINWHFIPPRSPNFGGLWESGVKSFKHHLRRIASNACFSYEELQTVITQIEGILNSRPLTTLSTDPNDPQPLTPGHFLTGGPIVSPIEPLLTDISTNRLSNWITNSATFLEKIFVRIYSLITTTHKMEKQCFRLKY